MNADVRLILVQAPQLRSAACLELRAIESAHAVGLAYVYREAFAGAEGLRDRLARYLRSGSEAGVGDGARRVAEVIAACRPHQPIVWLGSSAASAFFATAWDTSDPFVRQLYPHFRSSHHLRTIGFCSPQMCPTIAQGLHTCRIPRHHLPPECHVFCHLGQP